MNGSYLERYRKLIADARAIGADEAAGRDVSDKQLEWLSGYRALSGDIRTLIDTMEQAHEVGIEFGLLQPVNA